MFFSFMETIKKSLWLLPLIDIGFFVVFLCFFLAPVLITILVSIHNKND